jgi:CubicO group peptidase (beta-lactamase class C family)
MAEIQGTFSEEFVGVRDALARNLDSGADVGASAAVFIDGEPAVDIWGGYFDEARTRPWERDTIVNNFSTTKTMTALCALILADRGELDLDAPVVKYWPEFGANGKRGAKVRHLLHHTSGLPGWTEPVTVADILDWEKATTLLARQAPWWEPGTAIGYQSLTMGPLVGEVVRRTTGKTLKAFFAEEVAGPLGADYHIGAPPDADARVSLMIQSGPPRPKTDPNSVMDRVFFNPYVFPQTTHTIAWRRGDLGGSNGHGNARSVAMVQSVLACGGEARGVRLLSRAGCERALEAHPVGMDQVLGFAVRWGIGYAVGGPTVQAVYGNRFDGRRITYWGGSGGSFVVNDLDRRVTVAYVMNRHVESGDVDHRSVDVVKAAFDSLTSSQSVSLAQR